jgi:hypothetical protein
VVFAIAAEFFDWLNQMVGLLEHTPKLLNDKEGGIYNDPEEKS